MYNYCNLAHVIDREDGIEKHMKLFFKRKAAYYD